MKELYFAYGSNLNLGQMAVRCPQAGVVGKAVLEGYELAFRRGVLTILPKEGSRVNGLLWRVNAWDELTLDRYEGYPTFYYKETMNVEVFSLLGDVSLGYVDAIIYIMHEERKLGMPSLHYYEVCLDGYAHFGFDPRFLENALTDSVGKRYASRLLKEVGLNE